MSSSSTARRSAAVWTRRLAGLLRRLLVDPEDEDIDCLLPLMGLRLAPAHIARARRAAVGLSDRAGLLITEISPGPAARAGLRTGDVVVRRVPSSMPARLYVGMMTEASTSTLS